MKLEKGRNRCLCAGKGWKDVWGRMGGVRPLAREGKRVGVFFGIVMDGRLRELLGGEGEMLLRGMGGCEGMKAGEVVQSDRVDFSRTFIFCR